MKRFLACFLLLSGCAVPKKTLETKPSAPIRVASHPWRQLIVYVPQNDEAAATWLKWFAKYPELRMVIAMSPHFQHASRDPHVKAQLVALQKAGRLELALQIPNSPILPLLVDSSSAKDALPAGAPLPNPPYAYSDDVIQLIARSKAGFFKEWSFLPRGLVLPYGAASQQLVSMLERLGFTWVAGALQAPPVDGPYQSGPLLIWDASPVLPTATPVRVWDERQTKDHPLDGWLAEMKENNGRCLLPSDAAIASVPLNPSVIWKPRTWMTPDWSTWIGQPAKNSAWAALRKTREALEAYKNSGQASVQRLDAAFEEIYGAQNSNYFASLGNPAISPSLAEEREHEFQATLSGVYRMIGQAVPEDLFKAASSDYSSSLKLSSTTTRAETLPDGREHVMIEDAVGDVLVPNSPDLKSLEVWAATDSVRWIVTLASAAPVYLDIYVDLNGQPGAGTPSFLPGRPYSVAPKDAWEFALEFTPKSVTLYRTQNAGTYGTVQTFPLVVDGNSVQVTIPREMMRGTLKRWGYQVLVMTGDPQHGSAKTILSDFIDPLEMSQKELWQDLANGKRSDIPFIRLRLK